MNIYTGVSRGGQDLTVLPAHTDGKSIGVTPVTFEVQPGALRVFR